MLEIKNLHVSVDGKKILKGLDLSIGPGEMHHIMGPNGSGKSPLSKDMAWRDCDETNAGQIIFQASGWSGLEL